RRQQLTSCLLIKANVSNKRFPFKNAEYLKNAKDSSEPSCRGMRLVRADIEWILAHTQETSVDLRGADLSHADLSGLSFNEARFGLTKSEQAKAKEDQCIYARAHLENANLERAGLERAHLHQVYMEGAQLNKAHLENADLSDAQLQHTNFTEAHLGKTNLRNASLSGAYFKEAILASKDGVGPYLVDVHWENCNLAFLDLSPIKMLGEEYQAYKEYDEAGQKKIEQDHIEEHQSAVRANRQLALALGSQGLNEEASRFAYRAQLIQRVLYWKQHKIGAALFSFLLDALAGYGYKPQRSLIAYIIVIFSFMCFYLLNAHFALPHLTWDEALVLSVSSFHGRGFFPQDIVLGSTYARISAVEAILGLFIEISFIATFTQRFFGK
ncbi:MAG: pentapeptide repeat-containing protein, partial [Chloroflexi bacterium]|nr:pentapeptide repeat-containing protein [Chloroflexota bacterium]